jgi:hypothetical protein
MRRKLAPLLLAFVAAGSVAADEPARFRFRKDVAQAPDPKDELLAIMLDADVYGATRASFPDIRVLDERGRELPYALELVEERRSKQVRRGLPAEVVSLRPLERDALEVVVRLKEDVAAEAAGLSILSPLTNYEHRVRVEGSRDGMEWSFLVTDGLIFDYTRHMDVRNLDVPLPENQARWFRLTIEQVLDERESPFKQLTRSLRDGREEGRTESTMIERRPFRIDRIEVWSLADTEATRQPRKVKYPIESFKVAEDAAAKVTRIEVRTRREPLSGLFLETKTRNFSRTATVRAPAARGTRTEWGEVARGTVSQIELATVPRGRPGLEFPERREERYEIVIENGDGPPLDITGVVAEGNTYRLVLPASEGRSSRIVYGSDTAAPPRYDTSAVLAAMRPGREPEELMLGPQVEDPRYRPKGGRSLGLQDPLVLAFAIVLMVLVLAWALFRAGKKISTRFPLE